MMSYYDYALQHFYATSVYAQTTVPQPLLDASPFYGSHVRQESDRRPRYQDDRRSRRSYSRDKGTRNSASHKVASYYQIEVSNEEEYSGGHQSRYREGRRESVSPERAQCSSVHRSRSHRRKGGDGREDLSRERSCVRPLRRPPPNPFDQRSSSSHTYEESSRRCYAGESSRETEHRRSYGGSTDYDSYRSEAVCRSGHREESADYNSSHGYGSRDGRVTDRGGEDYKHSHRHGTAHRDDGLTDYKSSRRHDSERRSRRKDDTNYKSSRRDETDYKSSRDDTDYGSSRRDDTDYESNRDYRTTRGKTDDERSSRVSVSDEHYDRNSSACYGSSRRVVDKGRSHRSDRPTTFEGDHGSESRSSNRDNVKRQRKRHGEPQGERTKAKLSSRRAGGARKRRRSEGVRREDAESRQEPEKKKRKKSSQDFPPRAAPERREERPVKKFSPLQKGFVKPEKETSCLGARATTEPVPESAERNQKADVGEGTPASAVTSPWSLPSGATPSEWEAGTAPVAPETLPRGLRFIPCTIPLRPPPPLPAIFQLCVEKAVTISAPECEKPDAWSEKPQEVLYETPLTEQSKRFNADEEVIAVERGEDFVPVKEVLREQLSTPEDRVSQTPWDGNQKDPVSPSAENIDLSFSRSGHVLQGESVPDVQSSDLPILPHDPPSTTVAAEIITELFTERKIHQLLPDCALRAIGLADQEIVTSNTVIDTGAIEFEVAPKFSPTKSCAIVHPSSLKPPRIESIGNQNDDVCVANITEPTAPTLHPATDELQNFSQPAIDDGVVLQEDSSKGNEETRKDTNDEGVDEAHSVLTVEEVVIPGLGLLEFSEEDFSCVQIPKELFSVVSTAKQESIGETSVTVNHEASTSSVTGVHSAEESKLEVPVVVDAFVPVDGKEEEPPSAEAVPPDAAEETRLKQNFVQVADPSENRDNDPRAWSLFRQRARYNPAFLAAEYFPDTSNHERRGLLHCNLTSAPSTSYARALHVTGLPEDVYERNRRLIERLALSETRIPMEKLLAEIRDSILKERERNVDFSSRLLWKAEEYESRNLENAMKRGENFQWARQIHVANLERHQANHRGRVARILEEFNDRGEQTLSDQEFLERYFGFGDTSETHPGLALMRAADFHEAVRHRLEISRYETEYYAHHNLAMSSSQAPYLNRGFMQSEADRLLHNTIPYPGPLFDAWSEVIH